MIKYVNIPFVSCDVYNIMCDVQFLSCRREDVATNVMGTMMGMIGSLFYLTILSSSISAAASVLDAEGMIVTKSAWK
jgi:hypothetical protein